jgi:hypothetical protein
MEASTGHRSADQSLADEHSAAGPGTDPLSTGPPDEVNPSSATPVGLRVARGVHTGALISLAPGDVLLVGSGEDCDVILTDAGVARHHCVLSLRGASLMMRPLDAAVLLDGEHRDAGEALPATHGTRLELGTAMLEIVADESGLPASTSAATPAPRPRASFQAARWGLVAVLVAAVAGALQPVVRQVGAQLSRAEADSATFQAPGATRSGAAVARDVAEVLRLSGIPCEATENGHGTVTVRGHLGNPRGVADVIRSRAIREIDGLKRVLIVNLDQPNGESDGTRIVSAVASDDPYIVTADGSRYYVGALLPQGGRLTGIEDGTILIERDGRIEHWKLPGRTDRQPTEY